MITNLIGNNISNNNFVFSKERRTAHNSTYPKVAVL